MQATYVCVANKKALPPAAEGANINPSPTASTTSGQRRSGPATGPRTGFPASSNGLIHRFFQGYQVPAFSGGVVTTFTQPLAAASWRWLNAVWNNVHPQSLTYAFMKDPLLSEEVLLAWEHVARLRRRLLARPDAFVVFPAPIGPKGLAYMPVLAGLAIPKNAPNPAGGKALIRHLLSVSTQAKTLSAVRFYPVVAARLSTRISDGLRAQSNAIKIMQGSPKALPSLLPIGLGTEAGNFNTIYRDTFTRTVIRDENVQRC